MLVGQHNAHAIKLWSLWSQGLSFTISKVLRWHASAAAVSKFAYMLWYWQKWRECCSKCQGWATTWHRPFDSTCASILHANYACVWQVDVQPMHNRSPMSQLETWNCLTWRTIKISGQAWQGILASPSQAASWSQLTLHHDHTVSPASKLLSTHHRFHLTLTGNMPF